MQNAARWTAGGRGARRYLAAAVLAALAAPPAASATGERASIPSDTIARRLERGEPVDLGGVTLQGPLVVRPAPTQAVARFRCRGCRIEGALAAEDVGFVGALDLSGTRIAGPVRMARARFGGPVLFEPADGHPAAFGATVDFNRATFDEDASFTEATFSAPASFASAGFRDDVSFADARFGARAVFAAAVFDGAVSFRSSWDQAFDRAADFTTARFGERADFRGRSFDGRADFSRADFRAAADLSRTRFSSEAIFEDARFADRSTFFDSTFRRLALFDDAVATATLDFTNARFLETASFLAFESTGLVVLDGSNLRRLAVNDSTRTTGLRIVAFDGVVSALDRYGGRDVDHFLGVIESAAQARDDLELANDARYERRKRRAEQYGPIRRLGDSLFYRGVAGYFVRPSHPLVTLALVAFAVALGRRYTSADRVPGRLRDLRLPRPLRPLRAGAAALVGIAGDTVGRLALVAPGDSSGGSDGAPQPRLIHLEAWVYRVLIAVLAIALANSNPTLRQMLDAVF